MMKLRYLAIAFIFLAGCGGTDKTNDKPQTEIAPKQDNNRLLTEIAAKLPRTEEVTGFEKVSEDRLFDKDGLRDYFNSETDTLLKYGILGAGAADYKSTDSELQFSVDVLKFINQSRAFGAYALNRRPDMVFVDVGVQGYFDGGRLVFYDSVYQVRISGYSSTDASDSAALYLAKAVDRRIGGKSGFPVAITLMPDSAKIRNSEKYYPSGLLGVKFFSPAYTCDYDLGDSTTMLVFIPSGSPAELEQYKEFVTHSGNNIREARIADIVVYFYDDDRYGQVILTSRRGRLIGLVHPPDRETGLGLILRLWDNIDFYTKNVGK